MTSHRFLTVSSMRKALEQEDIFFQEIAGDCQAGKTSMLEAMAYGYAHCKNNRVLLMVNEHYDFDSVEAKMLIGHQAKDIVDIHTYHSILLDEIFLDDIVETYYDVILLDDPCDARITTKLIMEKMFVNKLSDTLPRVVVRVSTE